MTENFKNVVLENEVGRLMSKTNKGHCSWTSRQDQCYFDENTLIVVFTQDFNDGTREKKYSHLLIITPAGIKTAYNEIFYLSSHNYENFDLFICRILNVRKEGREFKIDVKMTSGKEETITKTI